VDDDASVVMMCTEILQEAGFEAEGTSGGTEAIERCQKEDFDLLLIDLKMPGLNGLEVLRAVKESDPDIAAIIITGYGTLESAVEAMRLGAQEYLNKPFDGNRLVTAVQQVLAKKIQASAVVKGNLREMSLTSIVSINCNERNQARLRVRRRGREAVLFFEDGQIVHMALDSQEGEEVIYELLSWEEGVFELEQDVPPPKRTVTTDWSGLVLEGLRRIDEGAAGWEGLDELEERKEVKKMATKKSPLVGLLQDMAGEISGFLAAAVVGMDGMAIAEHSTNRDFDVETAAAQFALVMKLVQKSAAQIGSDDVEDNLVTSKDRYILTRSLGDGSYFLATAVDKEAASLGNVRLVTRMFGLGLWDAIPRRR
jgi:DNA-binding response OmpR family regulator/predicted regulator of Ras-like GTPase activity (Roadblock/LC7/MglB family)